MEIQDLIGKKFYYSGQTSHLYTIESINGDYVKVVWESDREGIEYLVSTVLDLLKSGIWVLESTINNDYSIF